MKDISSTVWKFVGFLLIFFLGVYAESIKLIDYYLDPWEQEYVIELIFQHLYLVLVSMGIAVFVGVSVGVIFSRASMRRYAGVVMYIVGLGQTLPSLAILALMMGILGVGSNTAIFALFAVSLLPIARNTLSGILEVPTSLIDAAKGLGMPAWRILLEVELPNALVVMITGIRIALVINIGTAALGYLIGAGGLGDLIFTGIQLFEPQKLFAGAIPTILLAMFGDFLMEMCIVFLVPRGLRIKRG